MAKTTDALFFETAKADLKQFGETMRWRVYLDQGRGEPREIGTAVEVDIGAIIFDRPLPAGAKIMLRHDIRRR